MSPRSNPPNTSTDGEEPQSKVAPGDPYRELIHEVRNLSTQVALLHTIFVKRTVLYWLLGIETAVVVGALTFLGVFVGIENTNQNNLVDKTVGSCQVRNAQVDATKTYLQRQLQLQQESQGLTAVFLSQLKVTFTPAQQEEIVHLTAESQQALHDYFVAQPKDVDCKKYKS